MKRAPALRRGSVRSQSGETQQKGKGAGFRYSADLGPGAVGITAGGAAHLAPAALDPDQVHEVAAARAAALVVGLGDDLAVAAVVGVAPAHGTAGRAALPGVVLGLPGKLAVARIEIAADRVA